MDALSGKLFKRARSLALEIERGDYNALSHDQRVRLRMLPVFLATWSGEAEALEELAVGNPQAIAAAVAEVRRVALPVGAVAAAVFAAGALIGAIITRWA